jgi:iron complex outermembrane receptor protein
MKRVFYLLASFCFVAQMHAQFSISGVVTGNDSEALPGANVLLQETYRGTTTDMDGMFRLGNLKPGSYTLVVSYLGYESFEKKIRLNSDQYLEIKLNEAALLGDEVIIRGTRVENRTPSSYSNIDKDELEKSNFGQDLPVLLNRMTSVVSTTDAGNGFGYTGMRIRGSDINRINVTLNGIPFNDSESHSVYWVDLPDIVSSVDNIQIQRGVGTSTNGAAAFGATIDLQTSKLEDKPFAKAEFDYGSYNSFKSNLSFGTGLLKNKFSFDGRLSKISSDGYIDRAWSDLKSFYVSGGFYTGKTILRLYVFSGQEETYQAWNGVPKARLNNDSAGMMEYIAGAALTARQADDLLHSDSRTYNLYTYPNQIDHYQQSHYQLHVSHQLNKYILLHTALHYTKGSGYYEEFKDNAKFSKYGLDDFIIGQDTIASTDLIRRKWLDNDFYGITCSLIIHKGKLSMTGGGGWNRYAGNHFGRLIWAQYAAGFEKNYEWYRNKGEKYDFNLYAKLNYMLLSKLNLFGDVQYRGIRYKINGINDDGRNISMDGLDFDFINPKFGLFCQINDLNNAYVSFSVAHREPNRSNYIDAPAGKRPTREILYDFELGYNLNSNKFRLSMNLYQMTYDNQLVLTGEQL